MLDKVIQDWTPKSVKASLYTANTDRTPKCNRQY